MCVLGDDILHSSDVYINNKSDIGQKSQTLFMVSFYLVIYKLNLHCQRYMFVTYLKYSCFEIFLLYQSYYLLLDHIHDHLLLLSLLIAHVEQNCIGDKSFYVSFLL